MSALTENQFDENYPLIKNHLDEAASWEGHLFETYGKEVEFVAKANPKTVWTWVEGDGGDVILAGMHYVNRIGYLISEKEWSDETEFMEFDTDEIDRSKLVVEFNKVTGGYVLLDDDNNVVGGIEGSIDMDSMDDASEKVCFSFDGGDDEFEFEVSWDRAEQGNAKFKPYCAYQEYDDVDTSVELIVKMV